MGNKCPAELTEAHLGQKDSETQIQQPSYSQILKGTQNQPPDQGKHFTFFKIKKIERSKIKKKQQKCRNRNDHW